MKPIPTTPHEWIRWVHCEEPMPAVIVDFTQAACSPLSLPEAFAAMVILLTNRRTGRTRYTVADVVGVGSRSSSGAALLALCAHGYARRVVGKNKELGNPVHVTEDGFAAFDGIHAALWKVIAKAKPKEAIAKAVTAKP